MRLVRENVERYTDNPRRIEELKEQGYIEVKDDRGTKNKNTGKARKKTK